MAGSLLKRNEWVVFIPPRGDGQNRLGPGSELLAFAPGEPDAKRLAIEDMLPNGGPGKRSRSLILLADARDVVILPAKLPPLSGRKLRLALPHVIEEQVLQDPAALCIALGPKVDDVHHLVGAMDRAWLEHVSAFFEKRGFKILHVWPLQLALPRRTNRISLAVVHDGLALRAEAKTLAWHGGQDPIGRADAVESVLQALGPQATQGLAGVDAQLEDVRWTQAVQVACAANGLACETQSLSRPTDCAIDFLPALGDGRKQKGTRMEWSMWRWPVWLSAACLATFLLGLNLDWLRQLQEQSELKVLRERKFKQAMPNARTDAEPILQLKRHLASTRAQAGQSGADDFGPLLLRISGALGPKAIDALASVELRDSKLRLKFQPAMVDTDAARAALRDSFEKNGLRLVFDGERETSAVVSVKT
jgi:general secretion pathway protein L